MLMGTTGRDWKMTSGSNSKDSGPMFDWLYPDLLHIDVLIDLLQKRCIKKDDLASLSKCELVELYNKYVLPLPQRKYKLNRRGREMHKKQIISAKNKKLSNVDEDQPVQKKRATGKLLMSFEMPTAIGDRLKPPPSCVSLDKKTIKLNSSATSSSSSSSSVAVSTELNKHKLSMTDADHHKTTKKIKLSESVTSDSPKQEPTKLETCETSVQEVKNDLKKDPQRSLFHFGLSSKHKDTDVSVDAGCSDLKPAAKKIKLESDSQQSISGGVA